MLFRSLVDEIAAHGEFWQRLRNDAIALIDKAHKQNPEHAGLDLNELRSVFRDQPESIFGSLIADLCADGFARKGSAIARAFHHSALPARLEPAEKKIREMLSQKPFDPPPRREMELHRDLQQVLRFLIASGEVIEVGSDAVLLRENFERMKAKITEFIAKKGPATVSELRQLLQSSRRVVVPLLERLDRDGVTRRAGDKRTLCTMHQV